MNQQLSEFLATANADDNLALAEAQAHTATQGRMIPRNTMNSVLAQAGMYNAFLAASASNDLIAAFMAESSTEYNFIIGNPTGDAQTAALDALIAGDYPQLAALKPALVGLANTPYQPFANATLAQVKAIRSPAVPTLADHGAQDFVVSISNKDLFSFVATLVDDCSGVDVTVRWREDGTQPWKTFNSPIRLTGGKAGDVLSQVIGRPRGINAARHFEFSYAGQYAGQIASVAVSVGQ